MIVLGITGSVGMGKSTVANMFAEQGAAMCNADQIVHALMRDDEEIKDAIAAEWPSAITDGEIDRQALGKLVFGDNAAMKKLEQILHPRVVDEEERFVLDAALKGYWLVVLDIPLLYETGAQSRLDYVAVVSAPEAVQRERVMARPNMSEEKFKQILARQMPDAEKRKRADFVIETGEGFKVTLEQVKLVMAQLKRANGEEDGDA